MKNIILSILIIILGFNTINAQNSELPFKDVKITDELYNDLYSLYKNNVIKVADNNMFYPDKLIPRDELLSIVIGVGCKDCINPSVEDFLKYNYNPFIDVQKILNSGIYNPYFYCISIGKNDGITQGYKLNDKGEYTCENTISFKETPFCPENNTTRIEAAAILLRYAKLWDDDINKRTEKTIEIEDVDNYWYGFAKKGIDIGLIKIDKENKIYPNEAVTRREFIHMAAIIFGLNFCEFKDSSNINDGELNDNIIIGTGGILPGIIDEKGNIITDKNKIGGDIEIYDKNTIDSCKGKGIETIFSNKKETTYDFNGTTENIGNFTYNWEFINTTTNEIKKINGKCLDNYNLITEGKWIVKLVITEEATNESTVIYSQITINNENNTNNTGGISVNINANPLIGESPLPVEFISTVGGAIGKITYLWDFGDGNTSNTGNPKNTYTESGIKNVILKIIDEKGNTGVAGISIDVVKNLDSDKDGLKDKIDSCPMVFGSINNKGCPEVDEYISDKEYPTTLSSEIKIYDKSVTNSCNGVGTTTNFPNPIENTYDFYGYTESVGDFEYKWQFTNTKTQEIINTTGKCLNNYILNSTGTRNIKLIITDKDTGKNTTSYSNVNISSKEDIKNGNIGLSSYITGTPISGIGPLPVDFKSYVNGGDGNYIYKWIFGDGGISNEKNPTHTFDTPGIYTVKLTVTDGDGRIITSQIQIEVIGLSTNDTDGDGINDEKDYCPTLYGSKNNNGCPDSNKDFGLNNACLLTNAKNKGGTIDGTLECISCPCVYSIEYIASMRKCDIIFPTITSPDKKTLYSRGGLFQAK